MNENLRQALIDGDMVAFQALCASGTDLDAADSNGMTPLFIAAVKGNLSMVDLLMRQGVNCSLRARLSKRPLLALLAEYGHEEIALKLIGAGADVHMTDPQLDQDALMAAAQWGRTAMGNALLDAGAQAMRSDKGGWTALTYAAYNGHLDIARILAARCDVPLDELVRMRDLAAEEGHEPLVAWLDHLAASRDVAAEGSVAPGDTPPVPGHEQAC